MNPFQPQGFWFTHRHIFKYLLKNCPVDHTETKNLTLKNCIISQVYELSEHLHGDAFHGLTHMPMRKM